MCVSACVGMCECVCMRIYNIFSTCTILLCSCLVYFLLSSSLLFVFCLSFAVLCSECAEHVCGCVNVVACVYVIHFPHLQLSSLVLLYVSFSHRLSFSSSSLSFSLSLTPLFLSFFRSQHFSLSPIFSLSRRHRNHAGYRRARATHIDGHVLARTPQSGCS